MADIQVTYTNTATDTPTLRDTAMSATTHTAGLDFEISEVSPKAFEWIVFDAASGTNRGNGMSSSRERATQEAVRFIAERRPGLHVVRNRVGWIMWHRETRGWMPLPLTTEADTEAARAFVAALPLAAGKAIHIVAA